MALNNNYSRNQQLAQTLAQFQPVQGGGLAGALAQGLAGFGTGYYGGKAQQQKELVRTQLADAMAKGDTATAMNILSASGIPEYENIGLKSQMDMAEKAADTKRKAGLLYALTGINIDATPGTVAPGTMPAPQAGGGNNTPDAARLAAASVVMPELAPYASYVAGKEKEKEPPKGYEKAPDGRVVKTSGFSDAELQSAGYANRMAEAEKTIRDLEGKGYSPAQDPTSFYANKVPGIGNYAVSPEFQSYNQKQADWVRAKLRKESGAVIGPKEMADEIKTYFPQPGDTPEVIAQKAASRFEAFKGMKSQASNSYETNFSDALATNPYLIDSRPLGTPNPQPANPLQQQGAPQGQKSPAGADANISSAMQAIQSGAPRDAVRNRLLQGGYTPEQLKAAGL